VTLISMCRRSVRPTPLRTVVTTKISNAFIADARAHIVNAEQLEDIVKAQAPACDYALFTALTNAQRVQ
jgi:hypothetical protein